MIKRVFLQKHKEIDFKFSQNQDDFIVDERPIKFSGRGNFLVLKVRKKNLDTWQLLDVFAKFLNVYTNEIGYAGLKDKNASTTQYISIPKKFSNEIKKFKNNKIQIIDSTLHNKKLSIGDLEGNNFRINLYNVSEKDYNQIRILANECEKKGLPNYFGYQRFGRDVQENIKKAKDIVEGELILKDKKLSKMLVQAYQSSFFNECLAFRIGLSKDKFKLLDGDIFLDRKKDKFFTSKAINESIKSSFSKKEIIPTGLLPGRKVFRSVASAREVEEKFDDIFIQEKGYRRDFLVYPIVSSCKYYDKDRKTVLEFSLPRGSYATVFIENIANKNFL